MCLFTLLPTFKLSHVVECLLKLSHVCLLKSLGHCSQHHDGLLLTAQSTTCRHCRSDLQVEQVHDCYLYMCNAN